MISECTYAGIKLESRAKAGQRQARAEILLGARIRTEKPLVSSIVLHEIFFAPFDEGFADVSFERAQDCIVCDVGSQNLHQLGVAIANANK